MIGSIAYLVIVVVGAWRLGFFDPHGKHISPSDWGNVLAGVFSPLAFLWLLYASLSQRAELELQREELRANNETQDEQRKEMQRQADMLAAQTARANAQATAAYQPIFVISHFESSPFPKPLWIRVENAGANIIDIEFSENVELQNLSGLQSTVMKSFRGRILDFWPTNAVCGFTVKNEVPDSTYIFTIRFKRLDLIEYVQNYEFTEQLSRLSLIKSTVIE
jgi:hypothetical protein